MKIHGRSPLLMFAALGAALGTEPALAQDATDAGNGTEAEPIGEVLVRSKPLNDTHTVNVGAFGERDLMDIPLSIQNYTAEDFQLKAARTLLDVLQNDPSVQGASVGGAYDNFRLRGFAIDFTNTLRRDGLSLAPYQDVALENIERIDALKGPSGFLYGFNSPGGSINYIVKRPTATPFWKIGGHLTSLDGRYLSVDTSHSTASGFLGVRANAAYEKVGSFDHAGDLEREFISAAADLRLSESVVLQLNADYQDSSRIADPLLRADQGSRPDQLDPDTFIEPPEVDRRDLLSPSWFRYSTDARNIDAKLDIKLSGDWFAVVQGNYSENTRDQAFQDLFDIGPDGSIGAGSALFYTPGQRYAVSTVQGFIGGKFSTGSLGHDIFTGVAHKQFTNRRTAASFPEITVGNVLDPVDPPEVDLGPPVFTRKDTIREKSVFFSDLITFTEQWQALLGARYVEYQSFRVDAAGVRTADYDESDLVPSVGLIFKPAPNVTTYASFSRGLEQGEFAPFSSNNAGEQTAPIESEQVELGVKADIAEQVNVGIAIFQIDRQAGYVNLANDFVLDGSLTHRGVEGIVTAKVSRGLKLAVSAAYLDTELEDVLEAAVLGKRTEGTPEWTGGLSLDYAVAAVKGLSLGTSVNFTTDRAIDAQNSGFIDGYTVVDANVGYSARWASRPVSLRLIARNLFDTYYYSSAFTQGLSVGRPREVVFSVSTDF
jgi:iron complex outermembrane receptor protein